MKKTIGFIIILALMAFALFSLRSSFKEYKVTVKDVSIKTQILYKGLSNSVDFTKDNEGNYYIAFKDRIEYIDKSGKAYNIFVNKKLNITSLDYKNKILYYASGKNVYSYNLISKESKEIIKNIPNYGDYNNSLVRINGDYLFVTIGSATNSGVVGLDNKWLDNYPQNHDITPKSITIKGMDFGGVKTGAFVPYQTRNIKGQIITQHVIGNSSIIIYNLKTGAQGNFAWGIRNMMGIDFNSEGKVLVTVGGMEERGLRPVKGDSDYIYQIKKNSWYGFPDYSGGDPISSPKFRNSFNKTIPAILDNHPTINPPAPIYQHKSVGSLISLAIDRAGKLGDKDCIYFYEKNDNSIYSLNKNSALKEKVNFEEVAYISSMKFFDNLIILDSKNGYLISMEKDQYNNINSGKHKFYNYLLTIVITLIVVILVGLRKKD
ncbi:hypothetical protein [Clostridium estertheticum]|uniref:Glucose/Sorbosone dehydrogenase domain-containing protein n=1 Tax=Clostridium estertheticum subsp. estertheticum TaxID=1552 RepID=A0A1J0GJG8_9CLOT|nr:hypothetical protein [Clostridium estertheticum]APC41423.1 hypothetical protein A7L45_15735 [Clostridium estertheticum subsp. estertheticum]MBU3072893.1 hypothetical protein [Clostridium estertheticum]MBU3163070.1 hypothetical protein [Clostridium estertheticum]MBU3172692.1 hypothetical protein [Clostridium estertheticum]MBZ9616679.1 hypothetical protein [Clostridium estertheticum subsp. laramiense]